MFNKLRKILPKFVPLTPERVAYVMVQVAVGTSILIIVQALYLNHPYFVNYIGGDVRTFMIKLFWFVLAIVWIDPILKLLLVRKLPITNFSLIFVYFVKFLHSIPLYVSDAQSKLAWRVDARTKTAFLSILVKFFFLPIMLNTAIGNLFSLQVDINQAQQGNFVINFDSIYGVLITTIFLIDTGIFAFGYTFEASWLHNKIRSVEPTMLGWVVALSTYPPFNSLTGQIFPMFTDGSTAFAANEVTLRVFQIVILVCHTIFVLASLSLFTKGSNLTNRGIVSWGPYRIVRHPAYVVKLTAFFVSGLLYAPGISYFLGWIGFTFIYIMRALTEERHLSMDPDYLEYKKLVKWRFLPGIV